MDGGRVEGVWGQIQFTSKKHSGPLVVPRERVSTRLCFSEEGRSPCSASSSQPLSNCSGPLIPARRIKSPCMV